MEIKGLTVAQVIEAVAKKQVTTKELAEAVGLSDRTVQKRISKLGYTWNSTATRHEPTGKYSAQNGSLIFVDLFTGDSQVEPEVELDIAQQEIATAQEVLDKPTSKSAKPKEVAGFLSLYLGEESATRTQRNYYMHGDVLSVIDKVRPLKRSEFINECLRQFFKDNKLL